MALERVISASEYVKDYLLKQNFSSWSCLFNKWTQLHEGLWNIKIFFDRENGWPHTAILQWYTKRRKPANVCNLNFISLKQHSFFLFPYISFSFCKCIMLASLMSLSMFLGTSAGTEVFHAEFWKSTFLFVCESYAGNQIVLAVAISCLFLCLWELKGNSDGNGFFGDVLRIWSGVEEQLMATPVRTPEKWKWKDRMEGFSVRERQCL